MSFPYPYATTVERMRPSPIREMFKLIQRPGLISFAGGLPDPEIFPVEAFAECAGSLRTAGRVALQYGASEGYAPLVDEIRDRMESSLGRPVQRDEVIVTTGSQQVMDLLGRVLLDPGDVVVVEAPTYPGALHTFRNLGARFALVPCDGDGMRVELLENVIGRCQAATGRSPKLIYSIVNFSNPSGACLSEARRDALVDTAARHGIPVLEDDPYGELRFDEATRRPVLARASEGVVFAGSFSKILAPGVRVAWAVGEPALVRNMVIAKQGVDLCTSSVDQLLVAEYCRRGHLDSHLVRIRAHYRAKRDGMATALGSALPPGAATWHEPRGGFFFWLSLATEASRVFTAAIDAGVAFLPGPAFFPEQREIVGDPIFGDRNARLCFTFANDDAIGEGCRRLASALRTVMETGGPA